MPILNYTTDASVDRTVTEPSFAFELEPHEYMLVRMPGKVPNTVLTIDQQLYNFVIHEYTEPLSWSREWSYKTMAEAVAGLAYFIAHEGAPEPSGWIRAVGVVDGRYCTCRARMEFGAPQVAPVITVDGEED